MNDIEKRALIDGFAQEIDLEKNANIFHQMLFRPFTGTYNVAKKVGKSLYEGFRPSTLIAEAKKAAKVSSEASSLRAGKRDVKNLKKEVQQHINPSKVDSLNKEVKDLKDALVRAQKGENISEDLVESKTRIWPWALGAATLGAGAYAVNKLGTPANLYPSEREKVIMNLNSRYRGQ